MKGDKCEFAHGGELAEKAKSQFETLAAQKDTAPVSQPSLTTEDFPALGSASKPSTNLNSINRFAEAVKTKPTLPLAASPSRMNSTSNSSWSKPQKVDVSSKLSWFDTGAKASSQYMNYREEAAAMAVERNRLFHLATSAFVSGNKAAAKDFSIQARELNERMQALHQTAAMKIYEARNARLKSDENHFVIDLHGLHPTEAIDIVEDELKKLGTKRYQGDVYIVTGTGNHSRGRSAKVLPEVRDYLSQTGRRVREATMKDGRGGVLCIRL